MLIEHLIDIGEEAGAHELSVGDLDAFYRQARTAFDASPEFRERSRRRVVLLQSGDPETLRLWRILVDESLAYFEEVYAKLGVLLDPRRRGGGELLQRPAPGRGRPSWPPPACWSRATAPCACSRPGSPTGRAQPLPLIIQKSDGGYGYAASDLAALRDRFGRLERRPGPLRGRGRRRPSTWPCASPWPRQAGWIPPGRGRGPRRRSGACWAPTARCSRSRAGDVGQAGRPARRGGGPGRRRRWRRRTRRCPPTSGAAVARMVGIGAVKYADLSTDRMRDYVFDWDRMLAFEGNTAPYLQYAHVRCLSIFRRGDVDPAPYRSGAVPVVLGAPAERALALALLGFGPAVASALEAWSPHRLCAYLFELAGVFTTFFETCPVLQGRRPGGAGQPAGAVRGSRRRCWPAGWGCSASRRRTGCSARPRAVALPGVP